LERALHIREGSLGPKSPDLAVTLTHLSIVLSQQGDLPQSRTVMERALSILGPLEAEHPLELAMALNYYGNILRRQGEFAEARVPLEHSLTLRERVLGPNHPHVARTLSRMGMLETVMGSYSSALSLFHRALRIHETALGESHAEVAGDANEIGAVYLTLGKLAEAKTYFERALRIQENSVGHDHPFVAVTLNALGQVAALSNLHEEARRRFTEALRIQQKALGPDHIFTTETVNALGFLEAQQGRLEHAAELFSRSARIRETFLGGAHPDVAVSVLHWARVLHAQGHYNEARAQYERARRIALSYIAVNHNLEENAQRQIWAEQVRGLLDYELLLVTMAAQPSQEHSVLPDSFLVAEQARGWTVQLAVARAIARQALKGDAYKAVRELDDLHRRRQTLWTSLAALYSQSSPQTIESNHLKNELDDIQRRITRQEKEIRRLAPRYAELALPKPVTVEAAESLLASRESLIGWLTLNDRVCIWLVQKGQPLRYRESKIPRDRVVDLVRRVRASLTPRLGTSSQEPILPPFEVDASRALYQLLIQPIAEYLDQEQDLLIVPDSVLLPLPIAALIGKGAEPAFNSLVKSLRKEKTPTEQDLALYRDLPWLGASYNLTILPSASALKLIRQSVRTDRPESDRFIGFGDPLLQGSGFERGGSMPRQRGTRVQRSDLQALNRLPGTREELLAMARSLGVEPANHVFLSEDATETRLRQLNSIGRLGSAQILAFSTHGLLSGELEGLSQPALVLTPPLIPTDEDDGLLSMEDILSLDLSTNRLVVLSACNTAGGEGSGDSLTGLARAFFFAGARALLVSQWSVDDEATQYLMTETFKAYGNDGTMKPGVALRTGMRAMMNEAAQKREHVYFSHPFAWAAFFIVGDGATPQFVP
jgi:CHAT domain-containing protein/Tfp pilus assembly protein PilF